MLPLGVRTYTGLGDIMQWSNEGLVGMSTEVVPTQELSKVLLNARVKRCLFTTAPIATINGNVDTVLQWADVSDWAEVQINGIVIGSDAAMPQPGDERIIVDASLTLGGTTRTQLTTAELVRTAPTAATVRQSCVEWSAPTLSHLTALITTPYLLPQTLNLNESDAFLRLVATGVDALVTLTVSMLAAERGVMNLYPGV